MDMASKNILLSDWVTFAILWIEFEEKLDFCEDCSLCLRVLANQSINQKTQSIKNFAEDREERATNKCHKQTLSSS